MRKDVLTKYFFIFVAALSSGYALMPIYPSYIMAILLLSLVAISFFIDRLRFNFSVLLFLITTLLVGYVSSFQSEVNFSAIIKLQIIIMFSYFFVNVITYRDFVKCYVYFMLSLSVGSLILYSTVNFTNLGIDSIFPVVTNSNEMSYHNLYVMFYFASEFIQYRNTGFFWEPGIFSSYLSLAILLIGHGKFEREKLITSILVLTVFTTYSTGGYILMFMALMSRFLKSNIRTYLLLVCCTVFMVVVVTFSNESISLLRIWFPEVTNKFFVSESRSVIDRFTSPLINLEAFSNSPVFGMGLNEVNLLYSTKGDFAQSSTVTYYLGAFGFLGLSYFFMILKGTVFSPSEKFDNIKGIVALVFILSMVNKEPHMFFCLTYITIFYWALDASGKEIRSEV